MFPILLNIVAMACEVWNSCRSSHDEGSQEWGRAGWGGRGHQETDRGWPSGQITTELHVSFFFFSLLESLEPELLLLSQSLLTNSKAMRHSPQVFTSLANILEPEKLPGFLTLDMHQVASGLFFGKCWSDSIPHTWMSQWEPIWTGHSHSWGTECDRWAREHRMCLWVRHLLI